MVAFRALRGVGVWVGACVAMGLLLPMASGATASQPRCLVVGAGGSYGNLQAAVNAASAGDTLKVRGTCYGDTTIGKNLTIVGQSNPGFGPATLNGRNTGSVVTVNEGVTVAITGLTITGGSGSNRREPCSLPDCLVGGGILNFGSVSLTNSTVSGNTATYGGGGIWNQGSVSLTNSTVSDNTAALGGGIGNGGSLTLTKSTVTGNTATYGGAGIENGSEGSDRPRPVTMLTNSTVSDNTAALGGGGIWNTDGSVSLTNSTVSDNTATYGGGIENPGSGSVSLTNSTVSGNTAGCPPSASCSSGGGGGIENDYGSITLTNSTVSNNTVVEGGRYQYDRAVEGGGLFNAGSVALNGSASVTGNTAPVHGGGIFNSTRLGRGTVSYGIGWTGTVSGNIPDDIFTE
jgi:hypothetical protein